MDVPNPFSPQHQTARGPAFKKIDGAFIATKWAGGPWDTAFCHGGAVAGLLVQAASDVPSQTTMGLARMTVDLFAPVPIGAPIVAHMHVDRDGRRLQRVRVNLTVEDRVVAAGSLLRVRVEASGKASSNGAPIDASKAVRGAPGGFANSFDIIAERGGIALQGPGRVWFRLAAPLVEGEPVDLIAQAVAIADFSSAIGMNRDYRHYAFPSVDLTVGFARKPLGEWIHVDASNHDSDEGRATCHATLSDAHGAFAQVIQTNFIERRASALSETGAEK